MKSNTAVICLSRVNGGMELASVKLARILSRDVNIDFIARDHSYILEKKEHFEDYNIKVHSVKFSSNLSFSLIFTIRKILIEREIKNIIFLGASEMKSLYFATLALDVNFIIRQGSKKTSSKKDFVHKLLYSNVNYFVGNCEYMKQNIIDILPVSKKAVTTRIYSSLKLQENINCKDINNTIELVHVGRIHPGKGQREAVIACEVLYENNLDFKMTFLGDYQDKNYLEEIEKYLKDKPFKEKIEFVGYTSKVKEYLQQSDIFIFPSLGEGMSNAIIESLGFGLVPIIYDDTSSPEFKELGFHIHLTKENNIKELKEKLIKVANDFNNEKQKAKLNHDLALEVFALEREKKEYLELLI